MNYNNKLFFHKILIIMSSSMNPPIHFTLVPPDTHVELPSKDQLIRSLDEWLGFTGRKNVMVGRIE
jgi:hypothetical protein